MQILTYDFKTVLAPLCATADIEQCNTVGWTALHHACFHGHNDVIQGNLLRSIDNKTVKRCRISICLLMFSSHLHKVYNITKWLRKNHINFFPKNIH